MINDDLLKELKKTGYKLTSPRREILSVLSDMPLSAQEVESVLLEKGLSVDLVTVYRTLELFCDLGIVKKIQFEDKIARFELLEGQEHHHHLVCMRCGRVEDIILNEGILTKYIETTTEFKIQRHSLEFFGFCKKCQN